MELAEPIDGRTQLDAGEIPNSIWQAIAKNIRERWNKTSEHAEKHLLGESLHTIYSSRFSDTELLPFLRERIESAPAEYKTSYKAVLFDTLLGRNWTDGESNWQRSGCCRSSRIRKKPESGSWCKCRRSTDWSTP